MASYRQALRLRPDSPRPTTTWATPWRSRASRRRPSPATGRRCAAARLCRGPQQPGHGPGGAGTGRGSRGQLPGGAASAARLPDAHNNLGAVLAEQGRLAEAEGLLPGGAASAARLCRRPQQPGRCAGGAGTARRKPWPVSGRRCVSGPTSPRPTTTSGWLWRRRATDEALACYGSAADQARLREALNGLAGLQGQGGWTRPSPAMSSAPDQPDYAEALNNLANAYKDQGRLDEAIACYRKAIAAKPELAVYPQQPAARAALSRRLRPRNHLCRAPALGRAIRCVPGSAPAAPAGRSRSGPALADWLCFPGFP